MIKQGYALVRVADGAEIQWWETIPPRIDLEDGDVVFGATEGWTSANFKLTPSTREQADPPDVNPVLPAPLITRKQLILGLLTEGFITTEEAISAAQTGSVPSAIQTILDASITDPLQKAVAVVTWASMRDVLRTDPLTQMIQMSRGMTDAQVDAMWGRWSAL